MSVHLSCLHTFGISHAFTLSNHASHTVHTPNQMHCTPSMMMVKLVDFFSLLGVFQCQPAVVYTAPEYLVHYCCRVQLYCAHAADTTLPSRYRNFVN